MVEPMRKAYLTWAGIAVAFVGYLALIRAVAIPHAPWGDEAESWLVARNFDLATMYFKVLRYEGHPGLWYTVLWFPIHLLHMSYHFLPWYAVSFACLGIAFFLVLSPFPLYLRMIVPFTFYLAFQYSVVARGYVLFPLLVFAIAYVYRTLPKHRILLGVLLGLLANLSFHGTLVAFGFVLAIWLKQRQSEEGFRFAPWRSPLAVFSLFVCFAAVCLWPARNALVGNTRSFWIYHHVAVPVTFKEPTRTFPVPSSAPTLTTLSSAAKAAGFAAEPDPNNSSHPDSRFEKVTRSLVFSYAPWALMALAYQALFALFLVKSKNWMFLIPFVLLYLFLSGVYSAPWHLGLMFVVHLAILWMVWEKDVPLVQPNLQNAIAPALFLLCVSQLPWTYHAVTSARTKLYSPGRAIADYIRQQPAGTPIVGFGRYLVVLPYFQDNIFMNNAYRGFFNSEDSLISPEYVVATKPTLIITDRYDPVLPVYLYAGYHKTLTDCSERYFPHVQPVIDCLVVLKYDSEPSSTN